MAFFQKKKAVNKTHQLIGLIVCIGLLLIGPFELTPYWVRIMMDIMMYAVVAQGLNIIAGFAGYHAFGNCLFFGIGAYTTGVFMTMGLNLGLSLAFVIPIAAFTAVIFGWPLLRLHGHYFAIATIGLNVGLMSLLINVGGITGGAMGLALPISPLSPGTFYTIVYFLMFALLIGATVTVWWLDHSPLGFAIKAGRDSEATAQVMGINTTSMKITAWALSGVFTALAGGVWAYWFTFIEPGSAFDINLSIQAYIIMLLGGMGTVFGPIFGAIFLELLVTFVWQSFLSVHLLILGLLIVFVVMAIPEGFIHLFDRFRTE